MISGYQTFYNHAGDEDLKKIIEDIIETCREEVKQLEKILKTNGIALPPASPEIWYVHPNDLINSSYLHIV